MTDTTRPSLFAFSHVHIGVADLERSSDFYRRLGFTVTVYGPGMASVRIGEASLELDAVRPEQLEAFALEMGRDRVVIAYTVPDLIRYREEIIAFGVDVVEAPTRRPWGAFNFYLLDPDGYKVEVLEEKDQGGGGGGGG